MIRLGKDKTLDNYFIDENGVITDSNGNVQKTSIYKNGREWFKQVPVHRILIYTLYGYKKGYVIHHKDENKLNNSLKNLDYISREEHASIHWKGKKRPPRSEEHKKNLSKSLKEKCKGFIPVWTKGSKWFNNGVQEFFCKECPNGCVKGRLHKNNIKNKNKK